MPVSDSETTRGFVYAIGAYSFWGLIFPVYMRLLHNVPAIEIVSHRIVWALPVAVLVLWRVGQLHATLRLFREPGILALAFVTATLISVNWGVYVYAVINSRTIDAALGYYINPLVNVLFGALFLAERPTRLQIAAIGLAFGAVLILTFQAGGLPWISLVLALTFSFYGLLRKTMPVGAAEGFCLEVSILTLPALGFIIWALPSGPNHFVPSGWEMMLLVGAGPATAIPLILFAAGARRLDFATIGILQYMAPTLIFLCAVFFFGEPFSHWQLVAFILIWIGVAIYVWSLLQAGRARRRQAAEAARVAAGTA